MSELRSPLPPPLSHEGIRFLRGTNRSGEVSQEVLSLIAATLHKALPQGDFSVDSSGNLTFSYHEASSLWRSAGRLEAIERSTR
jgi:hypothetical protein